MAIGGFFVYGPDMEPYRCSGLKGLASMVRDLADRYYPYRLETICKTGSLYRDRYGPSDARTGLGQRDKRKGALQQLVSTLQRQGFWPDDSEPLSQEAIASEHPLARMQWEVDTLFKEHDQVRLQKIWETLQRPPYGLFGSPAAMCVLGLLMRRYLEGYYLVDGINSQPLTIDTLARHLSDVAHEKNNSEGIAISRVSESMRRFCECIREIFDMTLEETRYPDRMWRALRGQLQKRGYPLWILKYAPFPAPGLVPVLDSLEKAVKDDAIVNDRYADEIMGMLKEPRVQNALRDRFQASNWDKGLEVFFKKHHPPLANRIEALNLKVAALKSELETLMQEECWLWREDQVIERLPSLERRLVLLSALNEITEERHQRLDDALAALRSLWEGTKLPWEVLGHGQPEGVRRLGQQLLKLTESKGAAEPSQQLLDEARRYHTALGKVLRDPLTGLQKYTCDILKLSLVNEDLRAVYESLPGDFWRWSESQARAELEQQVQNLERQARVAQLHDQWRKLTASESPQQWTLTHGCSPTFILGEPTFVEFCNGFDYLCEKSLADLKRYQECLKDHEKELACLADPAIAKEVLLRIVGEPYRAVFERDILSFEQLSNAIREKLQRNPMPGADRISQLVRDTAQGLAHHSYRQEVQPRLERHIQLASNQTLRNLLRELAQEPQIGLSMVSYLEKIK